MMMTRRRRPAVAAEEDAEIALSPLIDCVFLLLIFFLVTTILKRKEKQIQVDLPDNTASVSASTAEESIIIGLDAQGKPLLPSRDRDQDGSFIWQPLPDLTSHLRDLFQSEGPAVFDRPLQINAHRNTPFQKAIDALDLCRLQGFRRVSVKTRQLLSSENER